MRQIGRPIPGLNGGVELSDLCAEYLAARQGDLAPSSWEAYAYLLEKHVMPFLGHVPIAHLTPKRIAEWQQERLATGAGRTSISKTGVILKGILNYAVEMELVDRNPAVVLKRPRYRRTKEPYVATPEQIEAMRGYLIARDKLLDATLVSVLAYTGVRPGEALGLMWMDVGTNVLHVRRSNTGGHLKGTKTEKTRRVTLDQWPAEDLLTWQRSHGDVGFVFPRLRDGEHWRATDWNNWRKRAFVQARDTAGLPSDFRPYDLRHTRASYLIHKGEPVTVVANQMGHSVDMCMRTYAHLIEDPPEGDAAEWIAKARAA